MTKGELLDLLRGIPMDAEVEIDNDGVTYELESDDFTYDARNNVVSLEVIAECLRISPELDIVFHVDAVARVMSWVTITVFWPAVVIYSTWVLIREKRKIKEMHSKDMDQ